MSTTSIDPRHSRFDWARARSIVQSWAIWSLLIGILYLLRDFFALIFVTFVFAYLMNTFTHSVERFVPWRRPRIIVAFLILLGLFTAAGWYLVPNVKTQAVQIANTVKSYVNKLEDRARAEPEKNWIALMSEDLPQSLQELIGPTLRSDVVDEWIEKEALPQFTALVPKLLQGLIFFLIQAGTILFLGLLFSFLILLDLPRLQNEIGKLRRTRLKIIFEHASAPMVKVGEILGKTFQAQAAIAVCNTALTGIGLAIFGMPQVTFLLFIVFLLSFIPVAGVFISSVPICLIGLGHGGLQLVLALIAMITIVHMFEAYILNPRIMGAALHMNPVMVLAILTVGGKLLGPWGLILGVPLCYFVFAYAIWSKDDPSESRATSRQP